MLLLMAGGASQLQRFNAAMCQMPTTRLMTIGKVLMHVCAPCKAVLAVLLLLVGRI